MSNVHYELNNQNFLDLSFLFLNVQQWWWLKLVGNTPIPLHPFHIHDLSFFCFGRLKKVSCEKQVVDSAGLHALKFMWAVFSEYIPKYNLYVIIFISMICFYMSFPYKHLLEISNLEEIGICLIILWTHIMVDKKRQQPF